MSGKRRITVDEAQWSRLQRQAQQLKALQVNAPQLVADLQRQTQSELARVAERLGNRQRAAEQALSALSDQTQKLEHETNQRLEEQASDMQRRLAESAGQLRAETNAALSRQQQAWRGELAAEREHQRAEIARLDKQLQGQAQASSRVAQAWLQDAGVVHDLIRDTLPHERFAPGDLATLERRLDTARGNAEQGQSQAALAVAQETYHDLSELRLEIELRDREWTGLHTLAYEALLRHRWAGRGERPPAHPRRRGRPRPGRGLLVRGRAEQAAVRRGGAAQQGQRHGCPARAPMSCATSPKSRCLSWSSGCRTSSSGPSYGCLPRSCGSTWPTSSPRRWIRSLVTRSRITPTKARTTAVPSWPS